MILFFHYLPGIDNILAGYICSRRDGGDRIHISQGQPHGKHSVFLHQRLTAGDRVAEESAVSAADDKLDEAHGAGADAEPYHRRIDGRIPLSDCEADATADDNHQSYSPEIEGELLLADDDFMQLREGVAQQHGRGKRR